ncbi:glycosyltransferase [Caloranaerobacter ferrireducens]|uniref:glycosyltransferase n=1 Tax=Caloranaerobacter ferrireducens TaxID=1323370 RepID=UPI0009F6BD05|nr:glycosyltransferase [Caloranaerobacter ferrireducens]
MSKSKKVKLKSNKKKNNLRRPVNKIIIKRKKNNKKRYISGTKRIIIGMSFNTQPFKDKRFTEEWIKQRIAIFMNYTLQSLKAQTNQNFVALIKYHDKTKSIIENALSKYEPLPDNIQFVNQNEYESKIIEYIKGYDYLYLVRLDCDDMYHKTFIQQLFDYRPRLNTQVLINQKGYVYDSILKGLAKTEIKSPPFYTLIYKVSDYLDGKRYKMPGGHTYAIKLPHEILKKRNFIIVVHSNNTSQNTSSAFKRAKENQKILDKDKIQNILKDFMK